MLQKLDINSAEIMQTDESNQRKHLPCFLVKEKMTGVVCIPWAFQGCFYFSAQKSVYFGWQVASDWMTVTSIPRFSFSFLSQQVCFLHERRAVGMHIE